MIAQENEKLVCGFSLRQWILNPSNSIKPSIKTSFNVIFICITSRNVICYQNIITNTYTPDTWKLREFCCDSWHTMVWVGMSHKTKNYTAVTPTSSELRELLTLWCVTSTDASKHKGLLSELTQGRYVVWQSWNHTGDWFRCDQYWAHNWRPWNWAPGQDDMQWIIVLGNFDSQNMILSDMRREGWNNHHQHHPSQWWWWQF